MGVEFKLEFKEGQQVNIRQRLWIVENFTPGSCKNDATLVELSCIDDDAQGQQLSVLWECEPDAKIIQEDAWESVGIHGFDNPKVFAAYLNTRRWNCVTASDPKLFQSPFRAGIRIEPYQLEPLRKALELPRVNLLIADDVGLGKTIEAGLIASELLLRRRINTIVVVAPPSMLMQWQEEMESRFGLSFVIIDRAYYAASRRERGYGINPWTTRNRFIVSNKLLIKEDYASGLRDWLGPLKSKSLLILDEAHHAAPSSGSKYAIDSKTTRYVRELSDRFEHRLFLSATPHNGHSNSFSSLLEILDPNRFCRGVPVRRRDLNAVMVRRIKSDMRELESGFPKRNVCEIMIDGIPTDSPELLLAKKLSEYIEMREVRIVRENSAFQRTARLVIVTLQQRLLSSIAAFSRTIGVHRKSMEKSATNQITLATNVTSELHKVLTPIGADQESATTSVESNDEETTQAIRILTEASKTKLDIENGVKKELALLRELEDLADQHRDADDERIKHILSWINENMCPWTKNGLSTPAPKWKQRRVIIFTEWEDTRRYIEDRLNASLADTDNFSERLATFTGMTSAQRREDLKHAFNADPASNPIRILIATDAAREGLNFQRHCFDLFHFDLPWNPSRLEQRNGRIDRKLQSNHVVNCKYFVYKQRPEDRVLKALIRKTETIRHELGEAAQILDIKPDYLMRNGIRRQDISSQEQDISNINNSCAHDTIKEEFDDEEKGRVRTLKVRQQNHELSMLIKKSRKHAAVETSKIQQAIDIGLSLSGGKPLREVAEATDKSPKLYAFDTAGTSLEKDPSWQPTIDLLRSRKSSSEKITEWRKNADLRRISFDDPGEIGDDAVHVHLEHRLVRRILGRYISKGMIDYDLSRACITVDTGKIVRVVLIARLSLYGPGGSRLHEEIIEVAARWTPLSERGTPLKPYARDTEQWTLEQLDKVLTRANIDVPLPIRDKFSESTKQDVKELTPYIVERFNKAKSVAEKKLAKRARIEETAMSDLMDQQRKRIEQTAAKWDQQLTLGFNDPETKQLERNKIYWRQKLERYAKVRDRELKRIRESYVTLSARLEPVGLVYLWPCEGYNVG